MPLRSSHSESGEVHKQHINERRENDEHIQERVRMKREQERKTHKDKEGEKNRRGRGGRETARMVMLVLT